MIATIIFLSIGLVLVGVDTVQMLKENENDKLTPYRLSMFCWRLLFYVLTVVAVGGLNARANLLESKLDGTEYKNYVPVQEQLYKLK